MVTSTNTSPLSFVDRERLAVGFHREALRGSAFPPARHQPGTFLHGFLLPFSLIVATLRHRWLGFEFLRLTVTRALVVALLSFVAFRIATPDAAKPRHAHTPLVAVSHEPHRKAPPRIAAVARQLPSIQVDEEPTPKETKPHWPAWVETLAARWAWIVWFVSVLSMTETVVVFLSRRYDDWLSFHLASIARVRPDDLVPAQPKLTLEPRSLVKKVRRRMRGYIVIGAGIPLFLVFRLLPSYGDWLFSAALVGWSWYWLGVFSASKSAHAWADEAIAPSPFLVRELRDRSAGTWWLSPVRLYARLWARLIRGINAPAMTFERNPAPFLGLALARIVLSLPGLYVLSRPVIAVAAGRLCAENDPHDRFSLDPAPGFHD